MTHAVRRLKNYVVSTYLYRVWRAPDADLTAEEAASTPFRFFRSTHVQDLKLIVTVTLTLLGTFGFLVVISGIIDAFTSRPASGHTNGWVEFFKFVATYVGSAIGVAGFVIGWAYQTAAARLGVVDLFACEVSTLCRVGTIVDIGSSYVEQYNALGTSQPDPSHETVAEASSRPAAIPSDFVSQENYFPILQTNAEDLQRLEASAVNSITEFYTYVKAFRDYMRILDTKKGSERRDALIDAVYMLFLGYESGRHVVKDLIEYQPRRAEDAIAIMLTELKCYSLLMKHFRAKNDFRYARLELRREEYRSEVPQLCEEVGRYVDEHPNWIQAKRLIPELLKRYEEAARDVREETGFDRRSSRPRQVATRWSGPVSASTTPSHSPLLPREEPSDEYGASRNS